MAYTESTQLANGATPKTYHHLIQLFTIHQLNMLKSFTMWVEQQGPKAGTPQTSRD